MNKSSMLYWWPVVKGLHIPKPKTLIVEVPCEHLVSMLDDVMLPERYVRAIVETANEISFPLFVRTDMASAKHHWEDTCFVPEPKELFKHIFRLIDNTLAAGMFGELDPNALVFREYIPMYAEFAAFTGLPIAKERRYFVRSSKVLCHHPYWIEDAIAHSWKAPSKDNWRELLANLNQESAREIRLLTAYASEIGAHLGGYWSVDFAYSRDGVWYLIDLAEGEKSWHPKSCIHSSGN